jgi:hypothetical protein
MHVHHADDSHEIDMPIRRAGDRCRGLVLLAGPHAPARTVRQRLTAIAADLGLSLQEALDMEFLAFLAIYEAKRHGGKA